MFTTPGGQLYIPSLQVSQAAGLMKSFTHSSGDGIMLGPPAAAPAATSMRCRLLLKCFGAKTAAVLAPSSTLGASGPRLAPLPRVMTLAAARRNTCRTPQHSHQQSSVVAHNICTAASNSSSGQAASWVTPHTVNHISTLHLHYIYTISTLYLHCWSACTALPNSPLTSSSLVRSYLPSVLQLQL